jgi:hypothetical protein
MRSVVSAVGVAFEMEFLLLYSPLCSSTGSGDERLESFRSNGHVPYVNHQRNDLKRSGEGKDKSNYDT